MTAVYNNVVCIVAARDSASARDGFSWDHFSDIYEANREDAHHQLSWVQNRSISLWITCRRRNEVAQVLCNL